MKKKHALFQISLKVLLRDAKGRTLILHSRPGGMLRKSWDFPGGRIDMHEQRRSIPEIIKREVKEEIGNNVRYTLKTMPVIYDGMVIIRQFCISFLKQYAMAAIFMFLPNTVAINGLP